jgi:hypothetical protein
MPRIPLPAALAAAALTFAVALPASALAATEGPASGVCPFKQSGIVGGKITVGVNIGEASSKAAGAKARCGQVKKVVNGLVTAGAEMPLKVNGYRCTPTITGTKVAWKCVWRGGSPRTNVTLLFAYRYAKG